MLPNRHTRVEDYSVRKDLSFVQVKWQKISIGKVTAFIVNLRTLGFVHITMETLKGNLKSSLIRHPVAGILNLSKTFSLFLSPFLSLSLSASHLLTSPFKHIVVPQRFISSFCNLWNCFRAFLNINASKNTFSSGPRKKKKKKDGGRVNRRIEWLKKDRKRRR